jgi:hypothetical protein
MFPKTVSIDSELITSLNHTDTCNVLINTFELIDSNGEKMMSIRFEVPTKFYYTGLREVVTKIIELNLTTGLYRYRMKSSDGLGELKESTDDVFILN